MAYEMVTLCLPSDSHQYLYAAIEEAMAPFDLSADHEPYQGEWDQWWLGRPGEEFDVLPGHEHDPRLIRAPRDASGSCRPLAAGQCDGGPRGPLDFQGMRTRAADMAASLDPYRASRTPYRQRRPEWQSPRTTCPPSTEGGCTSRPFLSPGEVTWPCQQVPGRSGARHHDCPSTHSLLTGSHARRLIPEEHVGDVIPDGAPPPSSAAPQPSRSAPRWRAARRP